MPPVSNSNEFSSFKKQTKAFIGNFKSIKPKDEVFSDSGNFMSKKTEVPDSNLESKPRLGPDLTTPMSHFVR